MQNRKIHRAAAFASKIAFACFALIRRFAQTACSFPSTTRGKARRTDITVVPLADFALIRRWRDTFPTRGKATAVIPLRLETASALRWNGMEC